MDFRLEESLFKKARPKICKLFDEYGIWHHYNRNSKVVVALLFHAMQILKIQSVCKRSALLLTWATFYKALYNMFSFTYLSSRVTGGSVSYQRILLNCWASKTFDEWITWSHPWAFIILLLHFFDCCTTSISPAGMILIILRLKQWCCVDPV